MLTHSIIDSHRHIPGHLEIFSSALYFLVPFSYNPTTHLAFNHPYPLSYPHPYSNLTPYFTLTPNLSPPSPLPPLLPLSLLSPSLSPSLSPFPHPYQYPHLSPPHYSHPHLTVTPAPNLTPPSSHFYPQPIPTHQRCVSISGSYISCLPT